MRRSPIAIPLFLGLNCGQPLSSAPDGGAGDAQPNTIQDAEARDAEAPQLAVITVVKRGDGDGVVRSTVPGLDCGDVCSFAVAVADTVELVASPAADSTFVSWSDDRCTNSSCRFVAEGDRTLTVTFERSPVPLRISKTGNGSGRVESADGKLDCGATCEVLLPVQTSVLLTATSEPGSEFRGWNGPCSTTDPACRVTVTGATEVGAAFEATPCVLEAPDAVTVIALYGQSLAVGTFGSPALTTAAPYMDDVLVLNAAMTALCPAREGGACGPWPNAETSRTSIAATWRALRGSGKFIINNAGVGGLSIRDLSRGTAPYQKLIDQIAASHTIGAKLPGSTGAIVRAVAFVHGPADEANTDYEAVLRQLVVDVNVDARAATGQSTPVHFFIDQTSSWTKSQDEPNVALEQLAACRSDPLIHCVGTQFYLDYASDRVHLVNTGYRENGERFGAAMWRTLEQCEDSTAPYTIGAQAIGTTIRATFRVADPPLALNTTRCPAYPNHGFDLATDLVQSVQIEGVSIVDDRTVEITTSAPVAENGFALRYAYSGTRGGGGDCRAASPRSPGGNLVDQGSLDVWPTVADRSAWAMTSEVDIVGGLPPPPPTLAAYFTIDGTKSAEIEHSADLVAGPQMTLSAWLRIRTSANNRIIIDKSPEWSLRTFDNGSLRQLVFHTNGLTSAVRTAPSGVDVADGDWHHVAIVYDAPTVRWFIDCVPAGTGMGAAAIPDASAVLRIGHHQFAADVDIGDVAIYDDALDGGALFSICRAPISLCNAGCPLAWWRPGPADDPESPSGIIDRGPNAHHATGRNGLTIDCGWPQGAPCPP